MATPDKTKSWNDMPDDDLDIAAAMRVCNYTFDMEGPAGACWRNDENRMVSRAKWWEPHRDYDQLNDVMRHAVTEHDAGEYVDVCWRDALFEPRKALADLMDLLEVPLTPGTEDDDQ